MTGSTRRIGLAAGALSLALVLAGCGGDAPVDRVTAPVGVTVSGSTGEPSAPPSAPVAEGLGTGPTRSASPSPSRTTAKPKPPKSKAPPKPVPKKDIPPPPAVQPAPPGCTGPKYVGTQASRADVKAALAEAANVTYWPTSAPEIKVPLNLLKAIAWQESGWQSNIQACDGGVGLMQVMPGTASQINNRFGQSYQIGQYQDNAKLGANYLAWLIKYLSERTGLGYDINATDCVDHVDPCMLNAVISAYNMGPERGLVLQPDGTYDLKITNPRYTDNVRTLMTECECLGF
ncbi:transglycosylase SLT domain-containing protein [Micromonospora sp. NBC_01796]|uniref:transglycosylase SLT domain-containing protein n=1 Tax=Micromonospora sp. NBC_01796 TaxID=2975987 RepID=UPI002DD9E88E|nr:transglycosylase SLT domain-containing protein [Micromonospora sp. NBC_01796]WSA83583.1 lytic transglycosylase domain-containing protein [Micromonospora sp. NBC_01796]